MRHAAPLLSLLALLGFPGRSLASNTLGLEASLQARGGLTTDLALDEGDTAGGLEAGSRLRLDAHWQTATALKLSAQLDLDALDLFAASPELAGLGWGSPYAGLGNQSLRADPRHLFLTYTTTVGRLQLGQMGSDWGLGLVADSGDKAPLWGTSRHGDIVERALFATRPLVWVSNSDFAAHTFLAVGGDLVFRDSNADLLEGDLALQAVASLIYRPAPGKRELGLYLAYRSQRDRPDAAGFEAKLAVLATDLYGSWQLRLNDDLILAARGEIALLTGHTDRLLSEAAPSGVTIQALGWVAYPELRSASTGLSLGVLGGYASGDANANDDRLTRMSFNSEFRPSVVLFEELLAETSARSALRARDLAHVGVAPAGSQFLPSRGRVSGARFVGPLVRWDSNFAKGLSLKAGLLFARAEAPLADAYASFKAGGVDQSLWGTEASSKSLGFEFDFGGTYAQPLGHDFELELEMEYGHLFPGAAFELPAGRMAGVSSVWLGARLVWHFGAKQEEEA